MTVTYSDYINALKSNVRYPIIKLEFLDPQENVISSVTPRLLDGTLSLQSGSGSRRSCSLLLENVDGLYTPIPEGNLWANTKVKLSTGLKINGEDYLINRGTFVINQTDVNSLFSEKTVNINLSDKFSLLDGTLAGELSNDTTIPLGTNIEIAVQSLLTLGGEVKDPIISLTSITTPYTLVLELGNSISEGLLKLAEMLSWECWFDKNSYFRFQPPTNEQTAAPVWQFSTDEVTYLTSIHKYAFNEIKNNAVVIGQNINGSIVRGTASDTNPTSPTRTNLIGVRTFTLEDEVINTVELATGRAEYELKKLISNYENVSVECIPVEINEGDIITISDSSNGLISTDRYLVKSVNLPLRYDSNMSLEVWKVRII